MALHLTVAGSLEPLADHLAAVLEHPLEDPFTPELVAVPGGGVQAWLTARLARRLGATCTDTGDGVVANVELVFPATVVARALGEASGVGRWSTGPLTWAVHEVLQELGDELGQATDAVRARAVADLFDRYTLYRPEMVRGWSAGRDVDGTGSPLDEHHRWQPRLWRAVQEHLGGGPTDAQLVDDLASALEGGDASRLAPELPARLCLFGLASLPPTHLRVLGALAARLDVHVLAPASSEARWRRATAQLDGHLRLPVRRGGDEEEALAVRGGHPLVSSWGRASREANVLLVDRVRARPDATLVEPPPPPALAPGATLLQRLQHGIRADEELPAADDPSRRPLFDPATDPSVRWHRAHGPGRQVEVLRDALLHLFEERDDEGRPRFEPRDVAVLCPDPSAFAPLVEATFAGDPDHGVPAVPVRVADRSLRQDNPLLDAAGAVLDLLDGRFRSSSVLAFATRPPVRFRFGLDVAALTRISEWAEATNVRWGLGPADHERFGLPADLAVHTWRAGLDQLLVGATMAAAGPRLGPGEVAPFPTIEGDDVAVAGALAELVDCLEGALASLRASTTVEAWCGALAGALHDLCAVPDAEAWQWRAVERTLDDLRDEASVDGHPRATPVDPLELATLVRARLSVAGGRPRFGTGAVTVSSLTAQRAVPHRVVCLLGLDTDTASGGLAVEDLVAAKPCVGDRDPRSEQRAQLLDAVLAAGERLLLLSTGHDLRTSAELPPIVPLAELVDVVDATVRTADSGRASRALTVDHPRQPWAEAALTGGGLGAAAPAPWSFDGGALGAAEARRSQATADTRLLPEPLSDAPGDHSGPGGIEVVALAQLVAAVTNPARLLLAERLGLSLAEADEHRSDTIPLKVGPLEEWQIIDRLLAVHLSSRPEQLAEAESAWELVERRRGAVPPLCFGDRPVQEARRRIEAFDEKLAELFRDTVRDPHPVGVEARASRLADGAPMVVEGTVDDVCDDIVLTVTASRFKRKDLLQAWVRVAALTAHDPSRAWRAVTIARDGDKRSDKAAVKLVEVSLLDPADAGGVLALVDDLRRRALRDVVPAFPATTYQWWCKGRSAARSEWEGRYGEATDRWVATAAGSDFDDLLALPLRPDERDGSATCRLAYWAERVWGAFERTTGHAIRSVALDEAAP